MDTQQHHVYLAVPGHHYCWGTVTGVATCTTKHVAYPYTGGFGFSGTEDFNMLWTDAQNRYDAGEVTHFAMLHGDISPEAGQRWLDILLEEMDSRNASLVSAVSPIKDGRGLTSSGVADLNDPWRPFRRFTMREVWEQLPETFSNVTAGYPDRPLLHNTGMWVCDLRRQEFRQAVNGRLDMYFEFPTEAVRGSDGAWSHRRESEDWAFSRMLWLRGIRDTWITRRCRLTHHGKMDYGNFRAWGDFLDGDENTADKWRPALDRLPLRTLQMLEFELGTACNLASEHVDCPNSHPERYARLDTSKELDDDMIVATAATAYNQLGFTGLIGWIYYNEPLIQAERMFGLMARIKAAAPAARFILWTNGTLIPEDCEAYKQFTQIVISGYNEQSARGRDRLTTKKIESKYLEKPSFDGRLIQIAPVDASAPCLRPFVELIVDAYGNSHLCCYDWRGEGTLGNVHTTPFADLAAKWREQLPEIAGKQMSDKAPAACRACGHRWNKYQTHDEAIVNRARRLREAICK